MQLFQPYQIPKFIRYHNVPLDEKKAEEQQQQLLVARRNPWGGLKPGKKPKI